MSNQEREAFEAKFGKLYDLVFSEVREEYESDGDQSLWTGFQAGAAYQREQDKGLLDASKFCADVADDLRAELDALKKQGWQMPKPMAVDGMYGKDHMYSEGWNDALLEVVELNAAAPQPPVQEKAE